LYGTAHGKINIKQLPPEELVISKSQAHHSAITSLAWLKDDIISGSDDGTIKLWDTNLYCKRIFQAPSAIVALSPIDIYPEYFLSSQKNDRPHLWSITQDTPIINTALDDLQRGSLVYSLGNTLIHTSSWANQLGMIEHLPIEGLSKLLSLPETVLLSHILQVKRGKKYPISAENEKKLWKALQKKLHEDHYQGLRQLLKKCVALHDIRTHKKVAWVIKTKAP
jgi:WD40 repeat protein